MDLIKELNKEALQKEITNVQVGDTVRVHVKVKEGSRERIQVFEGTVIAKKHGGIEETITVRRISYGVGVEKVFPVHSPSIDHIEVVRNGKFAGPKLYYLRSRVVRAPRSRRSCKQLSTEQEKRGICLSFFVEQDPGAKENLEHLFFLLRFACKFAILILN